MFKAIDLWLPAYFFRPRVRAKKPRHVLLCICDHFEPFHATDKSGAVERVEKWRREFPKIAARFRDSGGASPRQTFFFPIEQYDPAVLDGIADLCKTTRCEVEIHLHHQNDTAQNLRRTLEDGKKNLARHGLLSHDESGALRYGFIHGNWALDNSHPLRLHCGVRNELAVLRDTGCFADFTMPSAPSRTQTRTINSIYYAVPGESPKSHDRGTAARVGEKHTRDFLLVQGPLGLNWRRRKFGILPRIENGDLTGANPPALARLQVWLDLNIHVAGRGDWTFVKLHTHGATERNSAMLLGEPMKNFHEQLATFARERDIAFHYVTAREMVNILHAAEDGQTGDPGAFRDYRYRSNIARAANE